MRTLSAAVRTAERLLRADAMRTCERPRICILKGLLSELEH
jgi:hypothetical protein